MARIPHMRYISLPPLMQGFVPYGMPLQGQLGTIDLLMEEYESVRLVDHEDMKQEDAAEHMGISRPTFTRIYDRARKIIAKALVEGKTLQIHGGHCLSHVAWYRCEHCHQLSALDCETDGCAVCHAGKMTRILDTEENKCHKLNTKMKIAIPTRADMVDDHFGHCAYYTIFSVDVQNNIIETETLPAPQGCGCKSNIASVLAEKSVSLMLAGNMGQGAYNKLNEQGIQVIRGCSGPVDQVLQQFLAGQMADNAQTCHTHDHSCSH